MAVRREHPEYGTRRIRDVLARFEGLGVPELEEELKQTVWSDGTRLYVCDRGNPHFALRLPL